MAIVDLQRRAEIGRERRARTRSKILSAAFNCFGHEAGLFTSAEDIATAAGVTRVTFYNHFANLGELRDALSSELTQDFLEAVTETVARLDDPRARASVATRSYLHRARGDKRWAWSMLNLSASGVIFGTETYKQAEITVREGMDAGLLSIRDSVLGRDLILGSALAAIATMLRQETEPDYPEAIVERILAGLGVSADMAKALAWLPMPPLER